MDIIPLEITFEQNEVVKAIYPVIFRDKGETILVDCGYPGFLPLLERAAGQHGIGLSELTGVIITHHDIDHVGALAAFKEKYPSLKVYASKTESEYISGEKKSYRLIQAENMFDSLPDEQKPAAAEFQRALESIRPVYVDYVFQPGDSFPGLKGVRIIDTPGHTPGHVSIYFEEERCLLAADAVVYENKRLEIANPQFAFDIRLAVESIKKLAQLKIDRLICYHGGIVTKDVEQLFRELVKRYENQALEATF